MSWSWFTYYVIVLGRVGWGGQGHDYLDYAGGGVQNWIKVDHVICARSFKALFVLLNLLLLHISYRGISP